MLSASGPVVKQGLKGTRWWGLGGGDLVVDFRWPVAVQRNFVSLIPVDVRTGSQSNRLIRV
jgi:hypothetical protein